MKDKWPRGRVSHSFLKTNYNLVGRGLGHGTMQNEGVHYSGENVTKGYHISYPDQNRILMKVKGCYFQFTGTTMYSHTETRGHPHSRWTVPEPSKWWQLWERKCKCPKHKEMLDWHRTIGAKSRICFKYSSCLAFALDLFKCMRRGQRTSLRPAPKKCLWLELHIASCPVFVLNDLLSFFASEDCDN